MKKKLKFLYVFLLFLPLPLKAQSEADEFTLMKQAVEYSAKADAYNAYCDKHSTFTDDFIKKFEEKRALSKDKKEVLLDLKAKYKKETEDDFKNKGAACKDLEFMMQRLEVMQNLKDVSYLLNGVDPSTLPQPNMPNIEELLPPKTVQPLVTQEL